MAISATTAEDTWFNGHKTRLGNFGGGICTVGTNGNSIVDNNLDIIDADAVVSSGCANSGSSAPKTKFVCHNRSVQFRDASDVFSAAAADDTDDVDDEPICGAHIEDEYYGRRLLLSALSAAAVVPARHRVVDFPFRRKKSYLFKRKRRPSLSNVVEIYEHSSAASSGGGGGGDEESAALSECKRPGGGGGGGGGRSGGGGDDDVVVRNAKTHSVCGERAVGTPRACVANARPTLRMSEAVDGSGGEFAVIGNAKNLISFSSSSSDVNSVVCTTSENRRLLSSACDLRDEKCSVRFDFDNHCSNSIKCRNAALSKSWYGGDAFARNFQPVNRRVFSNGAEGGGGNCGDDDDDDDSGGGGIDGSRSPGARGVVERGGIDDNRKSCVNYVPSRKSTCTCLAEYEDSVGEIGVNSEERVVLLQRSASVPDDDNDDALSTPPAKKFTTKSTSTTRLDCDVDDVHAAAVPLMSPSMTLPIVDQPSIPRSRTTTTTTTMMTSSTSKLGRWSRSKIDLKVPSLKSLVTMATNKLSASRPANLNYWRNGGGSYNCSSSSRFDARTFGGSPFNAALRRNTSLNNVAHRHSLENPSSDDVYLLNPKLRKCKTMLTLTGCVGRNCSSSGGGGCGGSLVHVEPLRMVNRLRVCSNVQEPPLPLSRIYSRCSSILSMASSSRYSLNSSCGFVPVSAPTVLCKVCLNEVPIKDSWTLQHCECSYCVDCVRSYVEFEINQGAYSISCPDAQCEKQGIILLEEIESLVSLEYIEKHKRYRLNREVEMDKSRTWCPRAGCETVCTLCSTDRCTPQSVHCPTCNMDFCSNCRVAWHGDSPCKSEEVVPGVTFDSELIKCCPMCSVPIEKDEGCAQMLCKRCKHVFCWYCLASLDDDFLLRHYDKGPCKNKLGHSRASVIWHRTQVISIFAGFGILLLIASPLLLLAAPCIVCCKCRGCTSDSKLDADDDLPEGVELQPNVDIVSASEKDVVVVAAVAADNANEVLQS